MTRPDVLVLVFDTLRPDYLSCYDSHPPVETPTFDSLAGGGTVFTNAFSVGPNTEVSHGALFTGRYPSETGLVGGNAPIPPNQKLLAEQFQKAGYRTVGVSGPGKIRSDLGFDRGFEEYVEPYYENLKPRPTLAYLREAATNPLVARDFIRTMCRGRDALTALKFEFLKRRLSKTDGPTFAFVNFLTCHTPYDPPRPYKQDATDGYSRPRWFVIEYLMDSLGLDPERISVEHVRTDRVLQVAGGEGGPYFADPTWLNEDELAIVRAWYGASVRYLDARLDAFVDWLDETGRLEDTLLVLTADHGEHLGEDGLLYHGRTLRDEVLHVPLVICGPGVPSSSRRTDLASLIDVFPTLCELLDLTTPESLGGRCLFKDERRDAVFAEIGMRVWSDSKFAEYYTDEQKTRFSLGLKCIRTDQRKMLLRSDGETESYRVDGGTPHPTSGPADPDLLDRLLDTLGNQFLSSGETDTSDGRVEQNLRDLGYID